VIAISLPCIDGHAVRLAIATAAGRRQINGDLLTPVPARSLTVTLSRRPRRELDALDVLKVHGDCAESRKSVACSPVAKWWCSRCRRSR